MFYSDEIETIKNAGQFRNLNVRLGNSASWWCATSGKQIRNFSSNDYLGLTQEERLRQAAQEAIDTWGSGAGASQLVTGHLGIHQELAEQLAQWIGYPFAVLFGSGFLTNLGVLTALFGSDDVIFLDRLSHASLIDGARYCGARFVRFKHKDVEDLQRVCEKYRHRYKRALVVTDSVFSMDGDLAPVAEIAETAKRFDALLMVDEAHALGILGKNGEGVTSSLPEALKPDIYTATLSKSLGSYGGFVCCNQEIYEMLVNRSRSLIYSTALPPASLAAALEAIRMINEASQREGDSLGEVLMKKTVELHSLLVAAGLSIPNPESPILPWVIGENNATQEVAKQLEERGFLTVAIRPPTVPRQTARIRITVSLGHTTKDFDDLCNAIVEVSKEAR